MPLFGHPDSAPGYHHAPLLDRIDLHIEVPALSIDELRTGQSGESSKDIRVRVEDARQVQNSRFIGTTSTCNARMQHRQIREHCAIDKDSGNLLQPSYGGTIPFSSCVRPHPQSCPNHCRS